MDRPSLATKCHMLTGSICALFVKWIIAVPMDGSQDSENNIKSLSNSKVVESHDLKAVDFYCSSSD